jgi:hypothetical protein
MILFQVLCSPAGPDLRLPRMIAAHSDVAAIDAAELVAQQWAKDWGEPFWVMEIKRFTPVDWVGLEPVQTNLFEVA